MTKYTRSRHVPLKLEESKAVQEEFDEFISEIQESGELLKSLRENKGLTEASLGEKVGLTEEHILLMERGDQPIPLAIAKMFGKLFSVDHHLFL